MKHGVRLPANKRPDMAVWAFVLAHLGASRIEVAADLDVSEPTARNLILAGRRIIRETAQSAAAGDV